MLAHLDFFSHPSAFEVHGRSFLGLSDQHRLLHAAGHLVTSPGVMRRWSSHADVLRLDTAVAVAMADGPARELVALGADAARLTAGLPVVTSHVPGQIGWAYGQDRRAPLREHLVEILTAPMTLSVKNQLSWLLPRTSEWAIISPSRSTGQSRRWSGQDGALADAKEV